MREVTIREEMQFRRGRERTQKRERGAGQGQEISEKKENKSIKKKKN